MAYIPNEVNNNAAYAAIETSPGVFTAPDHRWPGTLTINETADLREVEEATGGYYREVDPELGLPTFAGTYSESLTFETFPVHGRLNVISGGDGVAVAGATGAYEYEQSPAFARDDMDTATLVYGIDGQAWSSTGVRHDETTVTIDVDDPDGFWKLSSNLFVPNKTALDPVIDGVATAGSANTIEMTGASWTVDQLKGRFVFKDFGTHTGEVREILSNTATEITVSEDWDDAPTAGTVFRVEANMPVLTELDYEKIPTYETQLFLDPAADPLGATQIFDRFISMNVTHRTTRRLKRFMENPRDQYSKRSGRGGSFVSGQIVFENDRRDEYEAWKALKTWGLRVRQYGSVIDSGSGTRKMAQIDIPKGAFSTPAPQSRENNMTLLVPFRAYIPEVGSSPFTWTTINDLAQLP